MPRVIVSVGGGWRPCPPRRACVCRIVRRVRATLLGVSGNPLSVMERLRGVIFRRGELINIRTY